MAQRLLSIPWIYWSVLRAMVLSLLGLLFWAVFNSLTGVSGSGSLKDEPVYEGGMWWLIYTAAAIVATCGVDRAAGAPGWRVWVTIAVFVLGVLPLYWKFQWKAPPIQTPDVSGVVSVVLAKEVPYVDDAEILRSSASAPGARDPGGMSVPGSGKR